MIIGNQNQPFFNTSQKREWTGDELHGGDGEEVMLL